MHLLENLEDLLHLVVGGGDHVGALPQLVHDLLGNLLGGLVADAVLQRGPEVHGDGANLNLHRREQLAVGHVHRHVHHDVQTAVAVGLGILDVILFQNQRDVVLRQQQIGDAVDVVHVAADHAHARDVVQVLLRAGHGDGRADGAQLLDDAGHGFDAALDVVDRIVPVPIGEFVVQRLQTGVDLPNGRGIHAAHLRIVLAQELQRILKGLHRPPEAQLFLHDRHPPLPQVPRSARPRASACRSAAPTPSPSR